MPQSALARAVLIFCLGLGVLIAGASAWFLSQRSGGISLSGTTTSSGTALIGGPFELVDHKGQVQTDGDFRGRYMLIYFGYTFCPDVCPTALLSMTQALDLLAGDNAGAAEKIAPLFITIDPERDSVETLASYAPNFHEGLVALTGSAEQVAAAAKAYRVFYSKHEDGSGGDYLMDHSSYVYLMGPDGDYLSHFSHAAQADEIAAGLRKHLGL